MLISISFVRHFACAYEIVREGKEMEGKGRKEKEEKVGMGCV